MSIGRTSTKYNITGMFVAKAELLYTNTTQTTIVTLPADAVIWNVGLEIVTGFTGSGTDLLDIGVTTDTDKYLTGEDLTTPYFDSFLNGYVMSHNNATPDRMEASTNITFQYTDQNSDAAAGQVFIYVHYTKH